MNKDYEDSVAAFAWDWEDISKPDWFFYSANSFIDIASHTFNSFSDNTLPFNYHNARTGAFLFAHALELFLKGAICQSGKNVDNHHDLHRLYKTFLNLYPGNKFKFTANIESFARNREGDDQSPYLRYPTNTKGELAIKEEYFSLGTWRKQLDLFKADFQRLEPLIKQRYQL